MAEVISGATAKEKSALKLSAAITVGYAVVALVWAIIGDSQVILLDAIFTPLALLMTWGAARVSAVVAKGPSSNFPFGRGALIQIFVMAQALTIMGGLTYAVISAVMTILDGGDAVSGLSLGLYGLFSAITCLVSWWLIRRKANGLSLIEAEAAGWLADSASSIAIFIGGIFVVFAEGSSIDSWVPYVDSVLVIASALVLVVIPIRLLRKSMRHLQNPALESKLEDRIRTVVEEVRLAEGLPVPILWIGQIASTVFIDVAFVVEPDRTDVAGEDRVRRALHSQLDDLAEDLWLVVEFTHDPELVE